MTEWWTYRLSSFLMFSPEVYWRLVERYNAAWWPAQWLAVAGGLAVAALLRPGGAARSRAALLLLALAWAWVGWAFAWQRYAEIFLGAPWMAGAYAVEAVLLASAAGWPARSPVGRAPGAIAWTLLGLALLYPLLAPLTRHPWRQAELAGFMPDPTALATLAALGALTTWPLRVRIALAAIPLLSLLLGAATRWLLAQ
jgi:hypothetical protein